jgi:competence protein ComFC
MDFFLPRLCPSCKNKLALYEEGLCSACLGKILPADPTRLKHEYTKKFLSTNIISGLISLFVFEKDKELQKIIHSLKYESNFRVGNIMGNILGDKLIIDAIGWKLDLIIPIPLHPLKKAERGYNQSYYISKGVNNKLGLSLNYKCVRRTKYTETQTSMNIAEREQNIKGAFIVKNKRDIVGKNILIVDDVITSGSTVREFGKTLKENGAKNIYAASVAIAD